MQANVALGGKQKRDQSSALVYNRIEMGKAEGIFVVEGEDSLLID